jgi:hypothetical protein
MVILILIVVFVFGSILNALRSRLSGARLVRNRGLAPIEHHHCRKNKKTKRDHAKRDQVRAPPLAALGLSRTMHSVTRDSDTLYAKEQK